MLSTRPTPGVCTVRPPLKKSLFPVQRVAIIMASREAAKSFFFFFLNIFSPCKEMVEKKLGNKRKIGKCEKKCPYPALIESPGRWTGNKFVFKGGLRPQPGGLLLEQGQMTVAHSWKLGSVWTSGNDHLSTSHPNPLPSPPPPAWVMSETLYHRDDALLYITYVMLIWAAPIPADRCLWL